MDVVHDVHPPCMLPTDTCWASKSGCLTACLREPRRYGMQLETA